MRGTAGDLRQAARARLPLPLLGGASLPPLAAALLPTLGSSLYLFLGAWLVPALTGLPLTARAPSALTCPTLTVRPVRTAPGIRSFAQSRYLGSFGSIRRKVSTPTSSMNTAQTAVPHQW